MVAYKFTQDGSLFQFAGRLAGQIQGIQLAADFSGAFNSTIRNYRPKEDALNGHYKNPPIKKVQ